MKFPTILFSIFLLLLGCKEKDKTITKSYCEENPGSCQSVLEAKKFFVFKVGSWWVYEEETSHLRYSVYVTEYYNAGNYDFDIRTHSTLEGYNYHYWPYYAGGNQSCSQNIPVNMKCLYVERSKGKSGDFVGEDNCFFVKYNKNDFTYAPNNIYYTNNKIIVEDILLNFSVGDLNFGETVKIHELSTRIEGIQPTNHYWSKNVGLIRKELLDSNQIWNLVDYHIEI